MAKIVIYDATDQEKQDLKTLGEAHDLQFVSESLGPANVVKEAEVISVFVSSKVKKETLDKMPNLKLIACRSTGFNNIDLSAAKEKAVCVSTVPTYGEHTVAEYTFALLLALTRKLFDANEQVEQGQINANTIHGTDLHGKTIGIVGLGRIGQNVAKIAKAFGMKVTAYDIKSNKEVAGQIGIEFLDLDALLQQSHVISLHVPATPETTHMINEARLSQMKRGTYLINTARGELVDTVALVGALQSGQLAGAALDVIEDEKLMDMDEEELILRKDRMPRASLEHAVAIDVLQKMFNVIITAHNAYNTNEAIQRINKTTKENIEKFLKGSPQNEVSR